MSTASSADPGRPAWRRAVLSLGSALIASFAVVALAAQQHRPAPRFAGKMIAEPPNQGQPWTAPETTLPKFLVSATDTLFAYGVADPRGCEYRLVEISNNSIANARGFVLPERPGMTQRFVVCWDGLIYPALTVGEPADLDRDIKELAANLKRTLEARPSNRFDQGVSWAFPGEGPNSETVSGVDDRSPIKLCLLLRLGRADLAEALFAAGTSWTPTLRASDQFDSNTSELTLTRDWATSAFDRLISAHMSGDDVIALDAARRLTKFRELVSARAKESGVPLADRQIRGDNEPTHPFAFLSQLDDLLRDQQRRARILERPAIPKKQEGDDPSFRIAALIRELDQIDERQRDISGSSFASPGDSPLVKELIAEGDPAVAPLLNVLESDDRLTRSVTRGRGASRERLVHPVHQAAFAALTGILKTQQFETPIYLRREPADRAERKALADSIRQFWQEARAVSLLERWYRTLLNDSAIPFRWLEAAEGIVQPDVEPGALHPKRGTGSMKGESLRVGRDPSVASLMLRRGELIDQAGDRGLASACRMGSLLATWDEKASLPLLKDLSAKLVAQSDRWVKEGYPQNYDPSLMSYLARFTLIRTRLGDVKALDEYATWLRTITPKFLVHGTIEPLAPLLEQPEQPALASAANWLFNDPKSPWVPLDPEVRGYHVLPHFRNLLTSPLIVVPGFREGVVAGLADKTPIGTIVRTGKSSFQRKLKNLPMIEYGSPDFDMEGVAIGVEITVRRCDLLAWGLSQLDGSPRFNPFWSEPRRDKVAAADIAYLKMFGGRFTIEAPLGVRDFPSPKAHLKLPSLGKPATLEDVASARAIFTLEGEGETRLAKMPGFPQAARWVTLKDYPVNRLHPDGSVRLDYETRGHVWQAEEVRKGDGWERFYGFVCRNIITRVPASEIEFESGLGPWGRLGGGLDAGTKLVDPPPTGYVRGKPILVALEIRNRLGVTHTSPTEFHRTTADGKPAFRNGVRFSLWHLPSRGPSSRIDHLVPNEVVEPKHDTHFDPAEGSRPLVPLEVFEAMRWDLNDAFDLTEPGKYRLHVTFAADSGLGEGSSNDTYFQVDDDPETK